ncbi:MAG: MFS transporter [Chloroflexota bacterium]|nr:MFS transporter [Chloroflexota bacterium]MDE3193192.1 MFS transporter [Chloroflexota bacterium]
MPRSSTASHWQRTVQVVSLTQIAILVGFNFAFPFIPLLIQDLGVTDPSQLELFSGLAIGMGGIVMALASPLWGMLADRFGAKTMFVRAVGAGSIALALQAAVANVWQLIAARMLQGALAGTNTAGAMLVAAIAPKERTGWAIGLMNAAIQVGNLIGPVLGGIVILVIGVRGSFLVGALLLAACTVAIVALVEDAPITASPPVRAGVGGGLRDLMAPFAWPGLRGVMIVGSLIQIAYSGTVPLIAIYVQDLHRPEWLSEEVAIGLAFAVSALAAAVAMPILGGIADRHDSRRLLVVSLVVIAVGLVPQALVPDALVFLFFRLFIGVGLAGMTSAIAVLTRAGAPDGAEGRAFGALAAAQNLGWGFGPIIGSAVAAVIGIPGLYLAGAVGTLIVVVPAALSKSWFVPAEGAAEPSLLRVSEPAELP